MVNVLIVSIGRRDATQQLANYSNIEQTGSNTRYAKWEMTYEPLENDEDNQNYLPPDPDRQFSVVPNF